MGEHNVSQETQEQGVQTFMKALLTDLQALEQMLENGQLENGVRRIGAEQEMFLVDACMRPAPIVVELLQRLNDPRFTTEIGRFNLEANLSPLELTGRCLSLLHAEVNELVEKVRRAAKEFTADVLLTGILPTMRLADLSLDNLTPSARYREMNQVITKLRGGVFNIHIKGLDELQITHDNVMLEACNTSFQVHLQVGAEEFVERYNQAQVAIAPVLAAAVNSPLLLGHRLWQETRLALFQHSVDVRSATHQARSQPTRVGFGDRWVNDSILEVFHEDVARFRVILTRQLEENALDVLARGGIPSLSAWRLHNGTIWRWNRACYGVCEGRPHLRIEARALPSGPTTLDEVANAAFFLGLMSAMPDEYGDVAKKMAFDDAKENFVLAARYGLKAQFRWLDGKTHSASALILHHLLPLAQQGLQQSGLASEDVHHYLNIIQSRVQSGQTGAQWMLDSLARIGGQNRPSVRHRAVASAIKEHQQTGEPVHTWPLAEMTEASNWMQSYQTVGQLMTTDLFTVRPEDIVDLAASVMDWKHIRHVPVEDDDGRLVGIVSHRDLLRLLAHGKRSQNAASVIVGEIMKPHPITATPEMTTLQALHLMRDHNIGCLPVVEGDKLVGLITAYDFLAIAARLLDESFIEAPEEESRHSARGSESAASQ